MMCPNTGWDFRELKTRQKHFIITGYLSEWHILYSEKATNAILVK